MSYAVKEIFYTLQGEGAMSGRPAVFCRFTGCNLWSGREEDRSKAICQFCDTDFWGTDGDHGGKYSARELAAQVDQLWLGGPQYKYIVCTGGEPLLQLDDELVIALHERGFTIAVETNGTLPVPAGVDWVCMSPKAHTDIVVTSGQEIKVVYPQAGLDPQEFIHLDFAHFFIQPMDGPSLHQNIPAAIQYCLQHPQWRLSLQSHKMIGIR